MADCIVIAVLFWQLPSQPVFVDGRLDVYVGKTFDNMLTLTYGYGSPAWTKLVDQYDFDCVITTSKRDAYQLACAICVRVLYFGSMTLQLYRQD